MIAVRPFRLSSNLLVLCVLLIATRSFFAAEPVIRNLDIRGLRIGATTTLTVDGDNFGKSPRLLLPFAAKQTLKPGNTDKRAVFVVTLVNDVDAGYYNLRVAAESGVSGPQVIGVDRLAQQSMATPVSELPVALHGTIGGSTVAEFKFQGKAKQKVMIEVEAQRFGSKLRPVIHLYDSKKLQLGWSWGTTNLQGDTRLKAILPEDGSYAVTLHDAEYASGNPGFYRLKMGEWSFVDQVFPPVIASNQSATLELLGMAAPKSVTITPPKRLEITPLDWPNTGVWSGPRPFVNYSAHAEVLQQFAKEKPQELPAGSVGVSGRLTKKYGEDRYRVPVTPGQKLRLEVFAERIGSRLDTALVVRNEKGAQLARGEDSQGTLDPVLEYTPPAKTTSILVGVVDSQGSGNGIYRLVIDPQTPATNQGDFKLTSTLQNITLPVGASTVVPVLVERSGYHGKIDLSLNVPTAVKLTGTTIPEGADGALVTLERSDSPFEAVLAKWQGRSANGTQRIAIVEGHSLEELQPWLATEVAVAPSNAKSGDLQIDWENFASDARLIPGAKLKLPVKVTRPAENTNVKLTLLTSQLTRRLANNQPDPNKSLRQEKPITVPQKKTDGEVVVLVPVELSSPVYDVTVQAELLAGSKVLATAYAPVRRMAVHIPVVMKLSSPERIEATLTARKPTVISIKGKIERDNGVKADVVLTLTGLPVGAKAGSVTVKSSATDFSLNVTLPPTIAAGEIKGLKLTGAYAPNSKQKNLRVRCKDVEVTLVLNAPAK